MFRFIAFFREPRIGSRLYRKRLGQGRAVTVILQDDAFDLKGLFLDFERKIEREDVVDGKLIPLSHEEVKRRGGKRSLTVAISYEAAEALEIALNAALWELRIRRFRQNFVASMMAVWFEMLRISHPVRSSK